ncbi:GTPase-activating protein S13 [Dissostichus eleginoides]|nr:GTPase-activating protein S13 [Dissostichus eleginoides]
MESSETLDWRKTSGSPEEEGRAGSHKGERRRGTNLQYVSRDPFQVRSIGLPTSTIASCSQSIFKHEYLYFFLSKGCVYFDLCREEDGQWKEDQKLEALSDWVRDVVWAPSIGLPTSTIASCSQDGRVFIWTCDDPAGNTWTAKLLHKFNDVVWHVSWSITGNILAVSGGDNKVRLWKESIDGQWACISDVSKGQGAVSTITDTQQSEQ